MMSEKMHADWCRNMFRMLAPGGVWGVPRSGLVFRKEGAALVLIETMPHSADMPITEEQLAEYQASDYEAVKSHFEAADIPVWRRA